MNIYFASNRLGRMTATTSAISEVLTAGRFDSAFVQSAVSIPAATAPAETHGVGARIGGRASLGTSPRYVTSLHSTFDFYFSGGSRGDTTSDVVRLRSTSGQVVARVTMINLASLPAVVCQFQYWNGSAFVTAGPTWNLSLDALTTMNVRITCGAAGSVDIWQGEWGQQVLVCSVPSSAGLNAAVDNVALMEACNPTGGVGYISMFGVADVDLRSRRITSDVADGAGVFNDGTGTFADTNAFPRDLTESRVLPLSGNKFSMTKAARSIPGNLGIEALVLGSASRIGASASVANWRPGIAVSGTWYPFTNVAPAPNAGYEDRFDWIETNPVTGQRMTRTEYNAAQFGAEAQT